MMAGRITRESGRFGVNFGLQRQRVSFEKHRAFTITDFIFIQFAGTETGNKNFPHSRLMLLQWMPAAVPLVERSDHADPAGMGRPQSKIDARLALFALCACAQPAEQSIQLALTQRLTLGAGKRGFANSVGIGANRNLTAGVGRHQLIVQLLDSWQAQRE